MTLDECPQMWINSWQSSIALTNCLLTGVASMGDPTYVTNHVVSLSTNLNVFQTVGAGSYYLATNSPYRNAGTTNIDPTLLASLKTRTTYPPLLLTNQTVAINTTLNPQVQRDTDTPDLGYHYDPIDYLVDKYAITNATLTVASGAAIASYNETGIQLQDGSSIVSIGSPLYPNWFVRYSSVQEQSVLLGGTNVASGLTVGVSHNGNVAPTGQYCFSKFACPANGGYLFYDNGMSAYNNLLIQNCELWSGPVDFSGNTNSGTFLQNNLLVRVSFSANNWAPTSLTLSNNLIFGTTVFFWNQTATNTWQAINNAFDSSTITLSPFVPLFGYLNNSYNAYLNCSGQLNPTNATEIYSGSGLAYQAGPLGTFYQPTNSPLIKMGSTTADQVGLYHFTVTTNEVVEGTNTVSIGYHYVATDTNGIPLDTNGDGTPDYLEDANGNGLVDSGEIGWNITGDLGLQVIITRPRNGSILP
jgi:hypothetical protein